MIFRLLIPLLAVQTSFALTADELQRFIDDAVKSEKGAEVVIPPGRHVLEHALVLRKAKNLRLVGLEAEGTILQLPPLAFAEAGEAAGKGEHLVRVSRQQHLRPGMRLRIEAEGAMDKSMKKPLPYHIAKLSKVEEGVIHLEEPLGFAVPAGAVIRDEDAPNLIEVLEGCEGIQISKLTLDGGRIEGDPPLRSETRLGGIVAKGPPVKELHIERCFIQNCHGRGISIHGCEDVLIENCTIRDSTVEAIIFDQHTTGGIARHNHIARCLVGVELNGGTGCVVEQNDFLGCRTGIVVDGEGHVVKGNQFTGSGLEDIELRAGRHEIER